MGPSRLAWKEYRETVPVVLVAVGLVTLFALRPIYLLAGQDSLVDWQLGLKQGGAAILFFVALVVGVLAYAVEEEQGTLPSLLARPLTEAGVFTTKVLVRMGVLLGALLYYGVLELVTGAWSAGQPIKGSLTGAGAWLATIAQTLFGFSLGLYFGRRARSQTRGLLLAVLLFAGMWVILSLSPIRLLFESPLGGFRSAWVRDILLPALGMVLFVHLGARPRREGRREWIGGAWAASGALIIYGLVIWLSSFWFSVETPRNALRTLREEWVVRYGSFQQFLDLQEADFRRVRSEPPDADWISTSAMSSMVSWSSSPGMRYSRAGYLLTGAPSRLSYGRDVVLRPPDPIRFEAALLEHRGEAWLLRQVEALDVERLPERYQLLVTHLAALCSDPSSTPILNGLLESAYTQVAGMAALALVVRGEPSGIPALEAALREGLMVPLGITLPLGTEFRGLMEEWLESPSGYYRNGAQRWFLRHGTAADLERLARSELMDLRERSRVPQRVTAASLTDEYRLSWAGSEAIPELHAIAEEHLRYLESHERRIRLLYVGLDSLQSALRQSDDLRSRRLLSGAMSDLVDSSGLDLYHISALDQVLLRLGELRDPALLGYWDRSVFAPFGSEFSILVSPRLLSPHLLSPRLWLRARPLIPYFLELGEPGRARLRAMVSDPFAEAQIRFQAAALLVRDGESPLTSPLLRLWMDGVRLEETENDRLTFWKDRGLECLLQLLEEDHLEIAGTLIQNARELLGARPDPIYRALSFAGIGVWFWDTRIVESLESAAGQPLGWSLSRWERWWRDVRLQYVAADGVEGRVPASVASGRTGP